MEAILASSPPTPQLSAYLHLRRPSLGIVRPTGHVVVRDEGSAQHLYNHAAEACFGEWAAVAPPNHTGVDGTPATLGSITYELVLMPEEAVYLACVAGCLEVAPDSKACPGTCPTGGAAALGRLLELAVRADPTLANLAQRRVETEGEILASSNAPALAMRCALLRAVTYAHYRHNGYVVKDGVLLGCHFLLYRGAPSAVHSDYGVWLMDAEYDRHTQHTSHLASPKAISTMPAESIDPSADANATPLVPSTLTWQHIQALRRLLHDVSKKLLLCSVEAVDGGNEDIPQVVDLSVG